MNTPKTCSVGNGTAVHAFTSWTDSFGGINDNTECGAVENGGNALYGHRRKKLTVLEGDNEITCKRCIKSLEKRAKYAALTAPVESTTMSMGEYAAKKEAEAAAAEEAPTSKAAADLTPGDTISRPEGVARTVTKVGKSHNGKKSFVYVDDASYPFIYPADHAVPLVSSDLDLAAREAAMAAHPAGKAAQDPTVITTRNAIYTAESWAEVTGSLCVVVKIDQVDAAGVAHQQVAGTYRRTPKGARVGQIINFDRSIKVLFHCENHPTDVWVSKDPFSSQWFPSGAPHILPCDCPVNAHVLFQDYISRG